MDFLTVSTCAIASGLATAALAFGVVFLTRK